MTQSELNNEVTQLESILQTALKNFIDNHSKATDEHQLNIVSNALINITAKIIFNMSCLFNNPPDLYIEQFIQHLIKKVLKEINCPHKEH